LTYLYGCFSFFHPAMGDNFERVGRGDTRGALFCPFRGARIDPCSQLFPRFVSPFAACAGISFGARAGSEKFSLSLACGRFDDLLVAQIPPEIPPLTSYCGLLIHG
jgi:hypothetical protein